MARTARTNARRTAVPSDAVLRKSVLEERARRLAARLAIPEVQIEQDQHLVCEIGEALYALPLHQVLRTTPLTRLGATPPSTDTSLVGLAAENGRVLQVFDLAARLNLASPLRTAEGYLVILRRGQTALRLDKRPQVALGAPAEDGDHLRLADGPLNDRMATPLSLETLFPLLPRPVSEPQS
ncbi:chemotaxis protein CheW [Caulobacter sp. RHG1]|uniref:chemotaxis protein CheW n=1 Tax=Caulobacter sp. (strain RHG1) TaxID=2545762 RepID=UPI001552BFBC|nr:chemotaxis protein CheW [Caulobacter sp. RHG1]NQE61216.1 hypothetical protein [Caulobacter sp. RHG1]